MKPKKKPLVEPDPRDLPPRLLISYEYADGTTRRCAYVNGPKLRDLLAAESEIGRFLRRLIFNTKETVKASPDAPDDVWDCP